jgi:hypothetical protein
MVTDTEPVKLPPFGLTVGVATVRPTERIKAVVLVTLPPVAAMVIGKSPAGVEPLLLIVNTVEQLGLQLPEDYEAIAPEGSPECENETA